MAEAPWWRHLKGDPSRFLLDDSEPGAVWRALVEVLGRPADSPAVERSRRASRERGAAAAILAAQSGQGYWGSPTAYGQRWTGSAWQLLAVASLGADPDDPRVRLGVEHLLDVVLPRSRGMAPARDALPSTCFTAEVCAALARLGSARHPRVQDAIAWLAGHGEGPGWDCPDLRHLVAGACPIAAVAVLRLAADAPAEERPRLAPLARRAGDWLLAHGLFLEPPAPRGWFSCARPALGRTDLVGALAALARVGRPPDEVILRGLLAVLARQDASGCWRAECAGPRGGGEPSRWVTIDALAAVAAYGPSLAGGGAA